MSKKRNRRHRKNKGIQQAAIAGVLLVVALVGIQIWANQTTAYYEGLPFSGTTLGDPDAPVTVIEFFDFQCPACQTASSSIVKPLVENYVASGDVKFTYHFYPILGPESFAAAEAAYCAADQDAFWPYQNALFARRGTGNRGTYSENNLIASARQVGLDEEQFKSCLNSPHATAYVQSSVLAARNLNVPGTPAFLVNNVRVGASYSALEKAIEEALASARAE